MFYLFAVDISKVANGKVGLVAEYSVGTFFALSSLVASVTFSYYFYKLSVIESIEKSKTVVTSLNIMNILCIFLFFSFGFWIYEKNYKIPDDIKKDTEFLFDERFLKLDEIIEHNANLDLVLIIFPVFCACFSVTTMVISMLFFMRFYCTRTNESFNSFNKIDSIYYDIKNLVESFNNLSSETNFQIIYTESEIIEKLKPKIQYLWNISQIIDYKSFLYIFYLLKEIKSNNNLNDIVSLNIQKNIENISNIYPDNLFKIIIVYNNLLYAINKSQEYLKCYDFISSSVEKIPYNYLKFAYSPFWKVLKNHFLKNRKTLDEIYCFVTKNIEKINLPIVQKHTIKYRTNNLKILGPEDSINCNIFIQKSNCLFIKTEFSSGFTISIFNEDLSNSEQIFIGNDGTNILYKNNEVFYIAKDKIKNIYYNKEIYEITDKILVPYSVNIFSGPITSNIFDDKFSFLNGNHLKSWCDIFINNNEINFKVDKDLYKFNLKEKNFYLNKEE